MGALGLAGGGFVALVLTEFLPWGIVQMPTSAGDTARTPQSLFKNGAGIGLIQMINGEALVYRLAALVALGAIGFGLASGVARRRAVMGAALGSTAGLAISVIAVYRYALHYFDIFYNGFGYGGPSQPSDAPTVVTGAGSYLAFIGVGLLAGAAITAGAWQRDWRQSRSAGGSATGAVPSPVARSAAEAGEPERELTVSGLEPLDEHYFARPDTR
jgi:hypothetical protein